MRGKPRKELTFSRGGFPLPLHFFNMMANSFKNKVHMFDSFMYVFLVLSGFEPLLGNLSEVYCLTMH